jgi:pantoate--beta-alanine ligase
MSLQLLTTAIEFTRACDESRLAGNTLGLVPTMGALHTGHAALMHEAKRLSSRVAVTIFVNPTQFGPSEDFSRYPRSLERDRECCEAAGVSLLFVPSTQEMYPAGESTRVSVSGLTEGLCGASRPKHFDGVATIVTKLFVLSGTCTAIFGKKDYQQFKVIERLVKDLLLPVKVVAHPIVRDADGLALSSRNAYLSADERARAVGIVRGLSSAYRSHKGGERRVGSLIQRVTEELSAHSLDAQYASLVDADSLVPLDSDAECPERALIVVAAFCGKTRLIDNIVIGEDADPLG